MANALFEFDPTSEDSTNSPLEIWNTASYSVSAFSSPAPPLDIQYAGSVDTEGSLPSSRKHQNRQIAITVDVLSAAALRALQAKVAKIAREGGTAKLTLPASSEVIVFDLHAADTFEPQLDIVYFVNSGSFCTVNLSLIAKPYGRGPEVDLGDNVTTTLPWLTFTAATVAGDMHALGRLVVDNDEANSMRHLVWGIQSRYYSSASSAALAYEAEACLLGSSVLAAGPAGASGAGSNVARNTSLGTTPNTLVYLGATTAQTHIGTFRVFARVYAPNTNTGTVTLGAQWIPYPQGTAIVNTTVDLTTTGGVPLENQWAVVDLGLVTIPKVKKGSQGWIGYVTGQSTVGTDDLDIDWVALVPVDEGYGEAYALTDSALPLAGAAGGISVEVRHDGVIQQDTGGTYWIKPDVFEGKYLLIPPSGAEARTLRVICRFSRHIPLNADRDLSSVTADLVGDVSARLYVTPRYLVVPSP